jgi:hypothetical protein
MNSNPNGQNVKPENAPGHAPGKDKAWQLYPDGAPHGFFAATRGEEPLELIKLNKNAFVLAYVIAARARWSARFNKYNLQPGEAMLGDYLEYGFTEQEYRTAKAILEKHRFSTFKATNKGTIAKLSDTRLFAISIETTNEPSNGQPTDSQRTGNERVTTINKDIRVEGIEREKEKAASLSPFSDVPKDTRKEIARREGEISTAIERIKDDDANWNFSQGVRRCLTRQADLEVRTLEAKRAALKR